MTKRIVIGALVAVGVTALVAAPSAEQPSDRPSGTLVMGVHPPERVVVMDVRSGRTVSRPLPGGTLCHGEVSLIGGRIVFAGWGRGAEVSIGLGLRGRPKPIGAADLSTPSATPGRLWLARLRHHGRKGHQIRSLREVTVAGRTTFAAKRLDPTAGWFNLEGAVRDGLLLNDGTRVRIWDPRTGALVRSVPGRILGHSERQVAWCRGRCSRVHVAGPGGEITVEAPGGEVADAAFAPSGSLLAFSTWKGKISVADLSTGSVRPVRGVRGDTYGMVAWAPSGRWLFFANRRGRLMAYSPSTERVTRLPGRVRGSILSIAAG